MGIDRSRLIKHLTVLHSMLYHGESCDCLQCYDYAAIIEDIEAALLFETFDDLQWQGNQGQFGKHKFFIDGPKESSDPDAGKYYWEINSIDDFGYADTEEEARAAVEKVARSRG